ncbi:Aspartokinase [Pichia californica]|uniref:Aspartokinase n=1 Tax=Pichia californica TaxID=460514 RepID=A0A9P7BI02_9ASCO|nr:Aspartokinase [[Candida] californica]KAG0690168.1 Aspartokinase [[Candida] californica]
MSSASLSSLNSGWIVQKFGGTSVGKFSKEIAINIVKKYNENNSIAVVCSARSTQTKSEGTTTRLLLSAELAIDDKEEEFKNTLKLIKDDHIKNANLNINDKSLRDDLIDDTINEINEVERLLDACCIIGEISPKSLDTIMSCGEKLSCLFMTALLNDNNVNAKYINLSNIINDLDYDNNSNLTNNERSLDPFFYKQLSKKIADEINKLDYGIVPVLTGFFGPVPGGLLNSVGRGYTDLCAAVCAVGLFANELQIWKEVDGIFTADPRKVKSARLLKSVTPDEAAELTYYGSEVIHPFTMEQVINARIPIRIKNVINPNGEGTIIYPDNISKKGELTPPHPPVSLDTLPKDYFNKQKLKIPTAVTAKSDISVVNIHSNKKTLSHGFLANVFGTLDKHKTVVDLISTSEVHVSMAVNYTKERRKSFIMVIEELKKYGAVDVTYDLSIVSLVGIHMKQLIGTAGSMFKILADEQINIEMISQGANEINISCVISKDNVIKALNALHDKLLLHPFQNTNKCLSFSNDSNGPIDHRIEELRLSE